MFKKGCVDTLVAFLLLAAISSTASAGYAQQTRPAAVSGVEAVGVTVSDIDRSVAFYSTVLSFRKITDVEVAGSQYEQLQGVFGLRMRVVDMKLGGETLELTEYLTPKGRPIPADSRSNDRWFQHVAIIVADMDQAYRKLRQSKVQFASTGPQRLPDWNKNAGGIEAFYFKDPDGHTLEILHFPPEKGLAKWHRTSDDLFQGIDHTAIVVADTETSLGFYRDKLGMKVVGESENYGPEQEHLNHVFGARLRITSLRAARGPGVELLEYLTPRDGRSIPSDEHSNDLGHWQTQFVVPSAESFAKEFFRSHTSLVSPGAVTMEDTALGFQKGILARDPDGHAVELVER